MKHNWIPTQNEGNRTLITLEELGLNSLEGWDPSFSVWLFVGVSEISCHNCDLFALMITPNSDSNFPSEFRFICISCLENKRFVDFSMAQQSYLSDKYKLILEEGLDKFSTDSLRSLNFMKILSDSQLVKTENGIRSTKTSSFAELRKELRGNEDAPIPQGYRSIAWIRFYEAEAIVHAYKSKSNFELKSDSSEVLLKCLYFADDSEERRKFKANVQAIRVNNQNQRVIGWIRLEEARAVIEANHARRDIDFAHLKVGNGGKVQFFAEDLEVAKKYRSTTRLLRCD